MVKRHAVFGATLLVGLAGCAVSTPKVSHPAAPAAMAVPTSHQSTAVVEYVRTVQRQLLARCSAELQLMKSPVGQGDAVRSLELQIPVDPDGQPTSARTTNPSGDPQVDSAVVQSVLRARYLPPLPAELVGRRASIHWMLSVGADGCLTGQVSLTSQQVRPAEALQLALAQGHYLHAQEIVLRSGTQAEVIRVLQKTIEAWRARGVPVTAAGRDRPANLTPAEALLQHARQLAAVARTPSR